MLVCDIHGDPSHPTKGVVTEVEATQEVIPPAVEFNSAYLSARPLERSTGYLLSFFSSFRRIASVMRNITARREAEERAKQLESLVPVCSWCHNIRVDEGYWQKIESYIKATSGSHVTHGMCPECEKRLVEGVDKKQA